MDPEPTPRARDAILSARVVDLAGAVSVHGEAAERTLEAYRGQVGALVEDQRGRVLDFTGESCLADFPTATEAVTCGLSIQYAIGARNAANPDSPQLEFCIGVHLREDLDDAADPVGVAVQLAGLSEPGGICVSARVRTQVERRLEVAFEDLGEHPVGDGARPVHAYSVGEEVEPLMSPLAFQIYLRWVFAAIVLTAAALAAVYMR